MESLLPAELPAGQIPLRNGKSRNSDRDAGVKPDEGPYRRSGCQNDEALPGSAGSGNQDAIEEIQLLKNIERG